jgi:hypothetical protein
VAGATPVPLNGLLPASGVTAGHVAHLTAGTPDQQDRPCDYQHPHSWHLRRGHARLPWHTACSEVSGAMLLANCSSCGTSILDYSSVVEAQTRLFCCANCLAASRQRRVLPAPGQPTCVHCDAPLVDAGPTVDRHGVMFCCYNCAAASATLAAA